VPKFYFNLYHDTRVDDEEGRALPNLAAAVREASIEAREMAAESVRQGRLVLDHRIVITDARGGALETVYFGDVVRVESLQ